MSSVKISNYKFNETIRYLHIAYESIQSFSIVFAVNDNNIIKVYTDQKKAFANGNPWVIGISQNDANIDEVVEVQYSGISKVRFFSRNIPVNTNIYLQKNSNGVCCLSNEDGIETFKKNNDNSIICGFVLPRTHPIMGSTLKPRDIIIDVWINIISS